MFLCLTTQLSAKLPHPIMEHQINAPALCLSVCLLQALVPGQGNLSDSEKHSREAYSPADQGDASLSRARFTCFVLACMNQSACPSSLLPESASPSCMFPVCLFVLFMR